LNEAHRLALLGEAALKKVGTEPPGSTSTPQGNPQPRRSRDWPRPLPSEPYSSRLFSFVEGISGEVIHRLGPAAIALREDAQALSSGWSRPRPASGCKPLLEARLCGHRSQESKGSRVVSEPPRGAVEHLPQSLGTLLLEGGLGSLLGREDLAQGEHPDPSR
jgi:hypothetical protein